MPKVVDPISADEVKALRAALGLTHEAFARRLGVSLPTVQHWASGWRRPGHFATVALRQMQAAVAAEAPRPAPPDRLTAAGCPLPLIPTPYP